MGFDHDHRRDPGLHPGYGVADRAEQAVAPVGSGAGNAGQIEESAEVGAVALLFHDEKSDRRDEFRITDRDGIVAGGFHQMGTVR